MNALAAELVAKDGLPAGQAKAVAALLDPATESKSDAARRSGVARTTIDRALQSEAARRAMERVTTDRRDKARPLHLKSLRKLDQRVDSEDVSDNLLLGVAKVTADIIAAGVGEDVEQPVTEQDRIDSMALVMAACLRAAKLGKRGAAVLERRLLELPISPTLQQQLEGCRTWASLLLLVRGE